MDHISKKVFIGNSSDARRECKNPHSLIYSFLNVAFDLDYFGLPNFVYCKVGLIDGPGNGPQFELAVDTLRGLIEFDEPILLHCHEGRSRSVAVYAAYLAEECDTTLEEAIKHIEGRRPIIAVKPAVKQLAQDYLDNLDRGKK